MDIKESKSNGGDIMMKNRKYVYVVCLTILLILAVIVILIYNSLKVPRGKSGKLGNIVDNDYNNYLAGAKLCRIGDKLYFSYMKNELNYGIVEISSTGAKRLYWEGFNIKLPTWYNNELIFCDNNELYRDASSDYLKYYDFKSHEFVDTNISRMIVRGVSKQFCVKDDTIFYLNEENGIWNLLEQQNDTTEILLEDIEGFYIYEDKILYTVFDFYKEEVCYINEYNMTTKENKAIFTLSEKYIVDMFVENEYVVFRTNEYDCVYKLKLDSSEELQTIIENDSINTFNVYDNNIYICMESGLKVFNLNTNEEHILYSESAEECYIVDDKWVYIKISNSKLIRVSNDGKIVERVFG